MIHDPLIKSSFKCVYSQTAKCPKYTGIEKGCPLSDHHHCPVYGKSRDGVDKYLIKKGGRALSNKGSRVHSGIVLEEKEDAFDSGADLLDIFNIK